MGPLRASSITSCSSVLLLSFAAFLSAGSGELDKSDSVQSSSKYEAAMTMMHLLSLRILIGGGHTITEEKGEGLMGRTNNPKCSSNNNNNIITENKGKKGYMQSPIKP